jgi:sulfate transport system ATP-binding protein
MSLVVQNLTKRFTARGTPAVADVSFTAPSGGITTLLGPSGSGKSTVLRVVAGLEQPDSGTILFGDADVTNLPAQKRGLGFVFQSYALFKHMTVRRNVAFGLDVRHGKDAGKPDGDDRRKVDELLSLVQLDGLGDRYPPQLSGGQRQRVAFARRARPSSRRCCCSTSRSARWMRRCASSCATGCAAFTTSTTSRPCW